MGFVTDEVFIAPANSFSCTSSQYNHLMDHPRPDLAPCFTGAILCSDGLSIHLTPWGIFYFLMMVLAKITFHRNGTEE